MQFQVFTKEGRMESYLLDTNVQTDGVPMNLSGMSRQELDVISSRYKGELIVFKTGEDGRIISFETGAKRGKFTKYESEYASVVYSKTTNAFKPAEKSPRFADDNTVIFCVPQGESYTSDNYEILNLDDIADKQEFQNVTFYNVDNKFRIGVILIKGYVPTGPRTITSTKLNFY